MTQQELQFFSDLPRSFFDYFYHDFAQVTNPPLDFLREKMVTDLTVFLGAKPNIFYPKELIPLPKALEIKSPVLSLSQMEFIKNSLSKEHDIYTEVIPILFNQSEGVSGFVYALDNVCTKALEAVKNGNSVLILSDKGVTDSKYPIPSLLALSAVNYSLNKAGVRLKLSLIVETGEVFSSHQLATLCGFGAGAICPYVALSHAYNLTQNKLDPLIGEQNYIKSLETGLLKIMSKMGISVMRSYHGSRLFTPLGVSNEILEKYFSGLKGILGGLTLSKLAEDTIKRVYTEDQSLLNGYFFKEHPKRIYGERHSMTNLSFPCCS